MNEYIFMTPGAWRDLSRSLTAFCAAFVCSVAAAYADPPSGAQPQQKPAVIKTNVDEVSIDLVARDKHGHPLRDLRPDEIQVIDDGRPGRITGLRLITASDDEPLSSPGDTGTHKIRLTSVIFDRLQSSDANRIAARAAEYLFKEGAPKNISFSVWRFSGRLELVQAFTGDALNLKRATDLALKTSPKGQFLPIGDPAQTLPAAPDPVRTFAAKLLTTAALSASISREENAPPFVAGLLALIRQQASVPGRKTIVYFSDGQRLSALTNPQFESILGAANRAGVSIYSVDTSGVKEANNPNAGLGTMHGPTGSLGPNAPSSPVANAPAPVTPLQQPTLSSLPTAANPTTVALSGQLQSLGHGEYGSPMKEIAEQTGGAYMSETNNVFDALRRMIDDLATYYEATYAPAKTDYDGHFRNVRVHVTRPHVVVQARAGYFSFRPDLGSDLRPFELPLLKALEDKKRTEAIPLDARVLRFRQDANEVRAELVIELPLSEIAYQDDQNKRLRKMHFSVLALIKNAQGQIVQKMSEDLPFQTALENSEQLRQSTHSFQRSFTAEPGSYQLDIAVCDQTDHRMSTASLPFDLTLQPNGLEVSQISFVDRLESISQDADPEDLLRYRGYRVVPNLQSGQSSKIEPSFFFTVYPGSKTAAKPQVEIEITRDHTVIAKSALRVPDSPPGAPLPLLASFSKVSLGPGDYEIWAKATLDGATRSEKLDFNIAGDRALGHGSQHSGGAQTEGEALHLDFLVEPKLLAGRQKPTDVEINRVLDAARQRAVDFKAALPNFSCRLITRRSVNKVGNADWRQRDIVTQLLRYVDGNEDYHVTDVNGERAGDSAQLMSKGVWSSGEFGQFLDAVFSPKAESHFEWQGFADVNGMQTEAFKYQIARKHSLYSLTSGSRQISVAYRGFVYIDPNTMTVRRVSIEAEDIPRNFPLQESALTVDYNEFSVGGQQYFLPGSATLYVREGKRHLSKNEKQFRDYRRYAGESTIKFN